MKIKINELMILERLLFEIDLKMKFDLNFNDAYKLHEFLKDVGKITSYAFLIQDEYYNKFKDAEKLKEYHIIITNSEIDFNATEVINFIEYVASKYENEDFEKIMKEIKFW